MDKLVNTEWFNTHICIRVRAKHKVVDLHDGLLVTTVALCHVGVQKAIINSSIDCYNWQVTEPSQLWLANFG